MRCSRTANCEGCQRRGVECVWIGSAPSRTSDEVTIVDQEREIQRLNRLVRELRGRIVKLGGTEKDLVLAKKRTASPQSWSGSSFEASSVEVDQPVITPQSTKPPSSTASSSLPSPATSVSSADVYWATPVETGSLSRRQASGFHLLPDDHSFSTRRPSLQSLSTPADRVSSAPAASYTFPDPSVLTKTTNAVPGPAPGAAYPFPLPTSTTPSSSTSSSPSFPFFVPNPSALIRSPYLDVNTWDLHTPFSSAPTTAQATMPLFLPHDKGLTKSTTNGDAEDYFGVAGFKHIRKATV
ncbi:hypothetical protein JCM11251_007310 [Rhodosporidiobolus azoricus]